MRISPVTTREAESAREHGQAATKNARKPGLSKSTLMGSIIAGIAASTCCLGPLILLTLGISGSWIGNLSAMEPYRPVFIGITLILPGLTFHKLYRAPQACAVDRSCARPDNLHKQRIIFWLVSLFVFITVSFPWYGPWLLA
ncbi:MAG: mercury transporter MerT [Gammaproteobacteria bacterium]|nr:mercury transporter MerT [Gammaproteobacteria bacterium]